MKNKKYENLVADIELAIEKFEEIQALHKAEIFQMDNDWAYGRKKGSISAYDNVIGVLKNLLKND